MYQFQFQTVKPASNFAISRRNLLKCYPICCCHFFQNQTVSIVSNCTHKGRCFPPCFSFCLKKASQLEHMNTSFGMNHSNTPSQTHLIRNLCLNNLSKKVPKYKMRSKGYSIKSNEPISIPSKKVYNFFYLYLLLLVQV